MASFCKQCSIDMFGVDFGDFADITSHHDTLINKFAVVICEGCGPICVDHTGTCRAEECLENHYNLRRIRAI